MIPPLECPLSPREYENLFLLAEGLTYKEIALKRVVSVSTVRTQCHKAYEKLGVKNRAQAVIYCVDRGWFASPVPVETDPVVGEVREARNGRRFYVCGPYEKFSDGRAPARSLTSVVEVPQGTRFAIETEHVAKMKVVSRPVRSVA